MHSQHIKSTSGHTVNISRDPPPPLPPAHTIQNNEDRKYFSDGELTTLNKHRITNYLL